MKALRILLAVAVSMLMVGSVFAVSPVELDLSGDAEFWFEYTSSEVGDADAVNAIEVGDTGGELNLKATASKELDNGAVAEAELSLNV
jgi:hypothetical protein